MREKSGNFPGEVEREMKHQNGIWEKIEGIKSIKKELLVRFAALRQVKTSERNVDVMLDLARLDEELEAAYVKVRQCEAGSVEEELCLGRIRDLEDERFQMLSVINGNRINDYNAVSPR